MYASSSLINLIISPHPPPLVSHFHHRWHPDLPQWSAHSHLPPDFCVGPLNAIFLHLCNALGGWDKLHTDSLATVSIIYGTPLSTSSASPICSSRVSSTFSPCTSIQRLHVLDLLPKHGAADATLRLRTPPPPKPANTPPHTLTI